MKPKTKNNLKLSPDEMDRYSRHIVLPEIGEHGQIKLKNSSVLCIGCGGLGSPLLIYLSAVGIGHIGIVDPDYVEESNLQRQVIHSTNWVGQPKTNSAKSRILELNPYCKVETFTNLLTNKNALEIIKQFDVICDCTDNFESRYLINDACTILKKPIVYGAISKFEGQSTVFNLESNSPNFRDLVPEPPPKELLPTCSEAGVIGILPGLIGLIQAAETIKIITGVGEILNGRILVFNALKMKFREVKLVKDNNREHIKELINYEEFCSGKMKNDSSIKTISISDMNDLINHKGKEILIIDVRTASEHKLKSIRESISIPLKNLEDDIDIEKIKEMSYKKEIYIYCQKGGRSIKAILILKKYGIEAINISGGIESWNKKYS